MRREEVRALAANGLAPPSKTNGAAKTAEGNGERSSSEKDEEQALKLEKERDEEGCIEGERKKGVLRKLHLHKV